MKLTKSIEESQVCGFSMYRGVGHLPSLEQLWEIKADIVKIKVPWSTYLSTLNERGHPYPCFLSCKVWRLETALNKRPSIESDMGIRFKELTIQDYDTLTISNRACQQRKYHEYTNSVPHERHHVPEKRKRATEAYMYSYCQATGGRIGWLIYKDNLPIGYNVGVDRGDGLLKENMLPFYPSLAIEVLVNSYINILIQRCCRRWALGSFKTTFSQIIFPVYGVRSKRAFNKEDYAFVTLTPFLNQEHWSPVVNASDEGHTGIESLLGWCWVF